MLADNTSMDEKLALFAQYAKYLKELYVTSFTQQGGLGSGLYVEIFVNPSKTELRDMSKIGSSLGHDPAGSNVRFLADIKDKKVYAWSPNITHVDAWDGQIILLSIFSVSFKPHFECFL